LEPRRFDKRSDRPELSESGGDVRSIVVEPYRRPRSHAGSGLPAHNVARSPEAKLDEAIGLARAIDLAVLSAGIVPIADIRPATYIGKGKAGEFAGFCNQNDVDTVIFDVAERVATKVIIAGGGRDGAAEESANQRPKSSRAQRRFVQQASQQVSNK